MTSEPSLTNSAAHSIGPSTEGTGSTRRRRSPNTSSTEPRCSALKQADVGDRRPLAGTESLNSELRGLVEAGLPADARCEAVNHEGGENAMNQLAFVSFLTGGSLSFIPNGEVK